MYQRMPKKKRKVETENVPGILQNNVEIEELSGVKLENMPNEESDCVGNREEKIAQTQ